MDHPRSLFPRLPLELREAIWEFCLPADRSQIYFFESSNYPIDDFGYDVDGNPGATDYNAPKEVITGFPVAMHICVESRRVAKRHLKFREVTVRDGSQLAVPFRPFRPELDVFFVSGLELIMFVSAIDSAVGKDEFFKQIHHLALQSLTFYDGWDEVRNYLGLFSSLRHVSVAFGNCWAGSPDDSDDEDESGPVRNFVLADWTEEVGTLIHGIQETAVVVQEVLKTAYDEMVVIEMEEDGPWDKETGLPLFDFSAKKMIVAPLHE